MIKRNDLLKDFRSRDEDQYAGPLVYFFVILPVVAHVLLGYHDKVVHLDETCLFDIVKVEQLFEHVILTGLAEQHGIGIVVLLLLIAVIGQDAFTVEMLWTLFNMIVVLVVHVDQARLVSGSAVAALVRIGQTGSTARSATVLVVKAAQFVEIEQQVGCGHRGHRGRGLGRFIEVDISIERKIIRNVRLSAN